MLTQSLIGSFLVILSIAIEVSFIQIAITLMTRLGESQKLDNSHLRLTGFLAGATLLLFMALALIALLWALVFFILECLPTVESAFYFTLVTITTLGYGDVILPQEWRILSGILAANGLVIFGLNTAFLIETLRALLNSTDE